MTVIYSIYEVASADDRVKESARQGITIAAGVTGTMLAGLAIVPLVAKARQFAPLLYSLEEDWREGR